MIPEPSENKKKQKPPSWLIDNIAKASKNTRKIYLLYVIFLAYCLVILASISDRQIIFNKVLLLPGISLDVSLIGFFIIAPLVTISLFIYLQLCLTRTKGLITNLGVDYASIEKRRLYLWMMNMAKGSKPGFTGKLQRGIVKFSLWWLLPIILIIFAFLFTKKHEPILSYAVGIYPILGAFIVLYFWCRYEGVQYKFKFKINQAAELTPSPFPLPYGERIKVRGKRKFLYYKFVLNQRSKIILASIVLIFELSLLFFIIPWAMEGGKYGFLRPWVCVDLSYQVLAAKPEEEYKAIDRLNLKKIHLEGANLICAIFKKADLQGAYFQEALMYCIDLEKANLVRANLQEANLERANLQEANLREANLQEARLGGANLRKAELEKANLEEAELWRVNFQEANLAGANLQKAILWGANLQEANLAGANLQGADLRNITVIGWEGLEPGVLEVEKLLGRGVELLSRAKTLYKAKMDSELEERLKKDYPHLFEPPED